MKMGINECPFTLSLLCAQASLQRCHPGIQFLSVGKTYYFADSVVFGAAVS